MKELGKSIKSILNERISSPFYGTLIISWLLWNWKIPYVTFFIESSKLKDNKIDYILENCNNIHHLITFPFLSTIVILTFIPFFSNGAYWVTMIFDTWRLKKKNDIEKNQLLTLEQSVQLRVELQTIGENLEKILSKKTEEIEFLKKQLELASNNQIQGYSSEDKINESDLNEFLNNNDAIKYINLISYSAQTEYTMSHDVPKTVLNYYVVNDLIQNTGIGKFKMTEKGKREYSGVN
jgi:hypothetical protein